MGDNKIEFLPSSAAACCNTTDKIMMEGCANGVSYVVLICDSDCGATTSMKYLNTATGLTSSTPPAGFMLGNCDDKTDKVACVPYYETETFDASAGQTSFTLANAAQGDVRFSRNGATLRDGAATVSGSVVTYLPSSNNGEVLLANDRIEISYIYVVCNVAVEPFVDCAGNEIGNGAALITCSSLDGGDFNIDPLSGIITIKQNAGLKDCTGKDIASNAGIVSCDKLDPDQFTIDPVTGEIVIKQNAGLKNCAGNAVAANAGIVSCDKLNPDHFEVDPITGEISSKCCVEPDVVICYSKPAIVESAIASTVTPFNSKVALTGVGGGPEVVNFTYTTGSEIDGQYSLRDGSNNHTSGGGYGIAYNIGIGVTTPMMIYRQTFAGLTVGDNLSLSAWVKSRANNSNFEYKIYNSGTGALLSTYSPGSFNVSQGWLNHKGGSFVVPSGGSVRLEITTLLTGSANGNDPHLDDISLIKAGQTGACYKKVISGGVETWYDGAGVVITNQTTINSIKAEISSGVTKASDCNVCYGAGSVIVAGTGIVVTGSGTIADPYVISLA